MNKYIILLLLSVIQFSLKSQNIIKYFSENEHQYIGVSASTQFWMRYAELNTGSTIDGQERSSIVDISIRRYRLSIYGALNQKTSFRLTVGNNNVGNNLESTPKLLDAYVKHQLTNGLGFGVGKSAWVGLSRYTAPSTSRALGADIQYAALPLLNCSDDLLRKMNVFALGQFGILDYRFVLAKPTAPDLNPSNGEINFSTIAPDYQASGYIKLQFKDKEKQSSAYSPGSYHGAKEVLNFGFGLLYQPKTTVFNSENDTVYYAAKSAAVDLFYEHEIYRDFVFTGYLSYHHHNLGPNFIRQIGANNPADGQLQNEILNGKGVSRIVAGTGDNMHLDMTLLKPLASKKAIQFYASLDLLKLQALQSNVVNMESGINVLFNGHRSKLTFGYQNWAIVKQSSETQSTQKRKSAAVIQYQLKVG